MNPEILDWMAGWAQIGENLDQAAEADASFWENIWNSIVGAWNATVGFFGDFFGKIGSFFVGIKNWLIWASIILLLIAGFAGTLLPFLPGTTLILAGCCLHFFALGKTESGVSWVSLVVITILYVASIIVDNFSGAIGAKWFGSSKWGIWGAILGGVVGMFFSLPGIIIGPIAGVFLFEMFFAKKKVKEAGNSTVGTVVGGGAGVIAKMVIGILMIAFYLLDLVIWK